MSRQEKEQLQEDFSDRIHVHIHRGTQKNQSIRKQLCCTSVLLLPLSFPPPLSASSRRASQGPDTSAKRAPHLPAHALTPPALPLSLAEASPEEQEQNLRRAATAQARGAAAGGLRTAQLPGGAAGPSRRPQVGAGRPRRRRWAGTAASAAGRALPALPCPAWPAPRNRCLLHSLSGVLLSLLFNFFFFFLNTFSCKSVASSALLKESDLPVAENLSLRVKRAACLYLRSE